MSRASRPVMPGWTPSASAAGETAFTVAEALGVHPGMTGRDALLKML